MQNLDDLMKMAQELQGKVMDAQASLDRVEVEGVAGGGMVKVTATARGRVTGVSIDDSLFAAGEKQMLEDLVAAAFNDARAKVEAKGNEVMSQATGGLQMPPGFQVPF